MGRQNQVVGQFIERHQRRNREEPSPMSASDTPTRTVTFATMIALHGLRRQEQRENALLDRIEYLERKLEQSESDEHDATELLAEGLADALKQYSILDFERQGNN